MQLHFNFSLKVGFHCINFFPICLQGLLHLCQRLKHFLVNSFETINTAQVFILLIFTNQSYKFVDILLIIRWRLVNYDYWCKLSKWSFYDACKLEINVDCILLFWITPTCITLSILHPSPNHTNWNIQDYDHFQIWKCSYFQILLSLDNIYFS